ncbi:MAG: hypothetical protein NW237_16485 [Cyanobacteriota bacterium]|nr:hypothetical protein [Cyanobacteriota bacterium]
MNMTETLTQPPHQLLPTPEKQENFADFLDSFPNPAAKFFFGLLKPSLLQKGESTPCLIPPIEVLRAMPSGSLGSAYAEFLRDHHLSPIAYGPRRAQIHDVLHVLLGYGTDYAGEAAVQWFVMGCKPTLFNWIVGGYLQLQTRQWHLVKTAFQRGRQSPMDPDTFPVEELWEVPVDKIRERYHLI